jgi:pimeloyl-ACP methyl ester carboxylesterase
MAGASLVVAMGAAGVVTILGGRIQRDLVSADVASGATLTAWLGLLALGALAVWLAWRGRRWTRDALAILGPAWATGKVGTPVAGAVDDPVRTPGPTSRWLLVAPVAPPDEARWYEAGVGSSRRSLGVLAGLTTVLVVLGLAGLVGTILAGDLVTVRAAWAVLAVASGALVPVLAGWWWLVGDIDRRVEAARIVLDPEGGGAPVAPDRRWAWVLIAALAVAAVVPATMRMSAPTEVDRVCQSGYLHCRWLTVRADQIAGGRGGATTTVAYGFRPATERATGTLIVLTGGPGIAAIPLWDAQYEGHLDPRLEASFDIVTLDMRGVGDSGGVDCPLAANLYALQLDLDADPGLIPTFVDQCLEEAGVAAADVARYAGAQVVGDIEAIRQDLGVERLVVYGESYGTAIAQRYAMTYPEHVAALILDAPLDVRDDGEAQWAEAGAAFDDTLERTLAWCRDDPDCTAEMNAPTASWTRMLATIDRGDVTAEFADEQGRVQTYPINRVWTIQAVADAMYTEWGRSLALRALAAADRGDWVPLGRMIHGPVGVSEVVVSSEFAYHATWCADRADLDARPDPAGYLSWARETVPATSRLAGDVVLSGAACAAWPATPATTVPATLPLPAEIPVVVLTAGADPITPPAIGDRLVERWGATSDVYRIETRDGPHVTFGRGDPCVDDPVVELLLDGTRPPRRTTCQGDLVAGFYGVLREGDVDRERLGVADLLHDELINHPAYAEWTGYGQLDFGCRFGGSIQLLGDGTEEEIAVLGCSVAEGEAIHGTGRIDTLGITYDLRAPGAEWHYEIHWDGSGSVDGEVDGERVTESW